MPLLDFGSTRHLALVALTIVTHHGGTEAREAIAQHNRTLVKLVQEHRDDRRVAELAINIMGHAMEVIIRVLQSPTAVVLEEIGVRSVLETSLASLRESAPSRALLTHLFDMYSLELVYLVCMPTRT